MQSLTGQRMQNLTILSLKQKKMLLPMGNKFPITLRNTDQRIGMIGVLRIGELNGTPVIRYLQKIALKKSNLIQRGQM